MREETQSAGAVFSSASANPISRRAFEDRVEILRTALVAVLEDLELLIDAKTLRIALMTQSGEEIQSVVENTFSSTAGVVERLEKIVQP